MDRARVEAAGPPGQCWAGDSGQGRVAGWSWRPQGVAASPPRVSASLILTSREADSAATGDPETKRGFSMRTEAAERPIVGRKKAGRAPGQQGLGLGWGTQAAHPSAAPRSSWGRTQREAGRPNSAQRRVLRAALLGVFVAPRPWV